MVNGIGGSGAGKAAIEAALARTRARTESFGAKAGGSLGMEASSGADGGFAASMKQSIADVESKVERSNNIHIDALEGNVDLHEVAAQLKESEITFQFALQVRNKLIDAYREVMRMSV